MYVLENSANKNGKRTGSSTLVFQAAKSAHTDVCTVLLETTQKTIKEGRNGATPLFIAA